MNDYIPKKSGSLVIPVLLVVVALLLALNLFSGGFSLGGFSLTGKAVLDTTSAQYRETQGAGKDTSGDFLSASTSSSTKTSDRINVNTSFELESYVLPVVDVDITIQAEEVIIVGSEFDITLALDEPMDLKSFSGELSWENTAFTLTGELSQYVSTLVKIKLKGNEELKLSVIQGTVDINLVRLPIIKGTATGTISLAESASFTLNKEAVMFTDYRGPISLTVDVDESILSLDGTISEFSLSTKDFSVSVK